MTKKGTIRSIEPNGLWNGLTKYRVSFADGNRYTFFAKGDFKFLVGDKLRYEVTNEEYKNARVPKEEYKKEDIEQVDPLVNNLKRTSLIDDVDVSYTDTSIDIKSIKTNCIKASAKFNAMRSNVDSDTVINDAQKFFNFIIK
jgi:hypothetical protein